MYTYINIQIMHMHTFLYGLVLGHVESFDDD